MTILSRIRHYFFSAIRHSCLRPSHELKPKRSFSQGDIVRGLANPFEGKHIIHQKLGCRFNAIISSSQTSRATQNFILAPLRGLKLDEKIYPHEVVIHPNTINRLFKKSIAVNSQLFTVPLETVKRSFKLGNILGTNLEKIAAGGRIAIDPSLRDTKKKPVF